jgi:hypothetical protein
VLCFLPLIMFGMLEPKHLTLPHCRSPVQVLAQSGNALASPSWATWRLGSHWHHSDNIIGMCFERFRMQVSRFKAMVTWRSQVLLFLLLLLLSFGLPRGVNYSHPHAGGRGPGSEAQPHWQSARTPGWVVWPSADVLRSQALIVDYQEGCP